MGADGKAATGEPTTPRRICVAASVKDVAATTGKDVAIRRVGSKVAEPYQDRILGEIHGALVEAKSGVVMAPTGSGKSLFAAGAVLYAIELGRPALVLTPNSDLLRQNLTLLAECRETDDVSFGLLVAQGEKVVLFPKAVRNEFGKVTLATNLSLVNKKANEPIMDQVVLFCRQGGVVVVDEGQGASSDELGALLALMAKEGAFGLLLTATPFRTDGRDPLEPFGTTVSDSIIGVAHHDEVVASGRTVPTVFDLADVEFERRLGEAAAASIERTFDAMVAGGKSVDEASSAAFGTFFQGTPDPSKQGVARLLVEAVTEIWLARAAFRRLALIHADCLPFARALAAHAATTPLPAGHQRAGLKPRVGYVCGDEAMLYRDGIQVDVASRKRDAREEILRLSREGEVDVLVTVRALGVGTDIPVVDLTIIACFRRSIGPLKQASGRGERSFGTAKRDHLLVDVGRSVVTHWTELRAVLAGQDERASRSMLRIPPRIREQFRQWFDGDPALEGKIHERAWARARRASGTFGGEFGELDEFPTGSRRLPTAHPFCDHVTVAWTRTPVRNGRREPSSVAMVLDLQGLDLQGLGLQGLGLQGLGHLGADVPMARFLVGVYSRATGRAVARMTGTHEHAMAFARHHGVRSVDPGTAAPPWLKHNLTSGLRRAKEGGFRTPGFLRRFAPSKTHGGAMAFLDALDVMAETVRAMRDLVGSKCFDGRWTAGPPKSVVVRDVAAAEPARRAAFRLHRVLHGWTEAATGAGRDLPRVVVLDPSERAAAADAFGIEERDVAVRHPSHDLDWLPVLADDLDAARVAGWCADREFDPYGGVDWIAEAVGLAGLRDRRAVLTSRVTAEVDRLPVVELAFHDRSTRLVRVPRPDAEAALRPSSRADDSRVRAVRRLLPALSPTRTTNDDGWQVAREASGPLALRHALDARSDADPRHVTMAMDAAGILDVLRGMDDDPLADFLHGVAALVSAHLYDRLDRDMERDDEVEEVGEDLAEAPL